MNKIIHLILLNRPELVNKFFNILLNHFKFVPQAVRDGQNFGKWEKLGLHITEAHFYQPIPIINSLNDKIFTEIDPLHGINLNVYNQQERIRLLVDKYKNEFNLIPLTKSDDYTEGDFFIMNNNFTSVDSEIFYSIIREYKPRKIIEIGSGYSSFLALKAIKENYKENHLSRLTCIEPYPRDFFKKGIIDNVELLEVEVQNVPLEVYSQLEENDILFIDSSHVAKIGSDVCFEFFKILPILKKGVLIHFHDIFFPKNYPEHWIKCNHYFWNEQYLLQAFLMYNSDFEIFLSNSLIQHISPELLMGINSYNEDQIPGSIWLKKVR